MKELKTKDLQAGDCSSAPVKGSRFKRDCSSLELIKQPSEDMSSYWFPMVR